MPTAALWTKAIRDHLRANASAEHAAGVQWFFKYEISSHGWYTAPLRKFSLLKRKEILQEGGESLLMDVAEKMFTGQFLEEHNVGVYLLEPSAANYGKKELLRLQTWFPRIFSWADHDALVYGVISAIILNHPELMPYVFRWVRMNDRWHKRAACVALIRGTRVMLFRKEIVRITKMLLHDPDDMVQKGLGWLLRETAKVDPHEMVPFLMSIREQAPRLVLRTACEKLPAAMRQQVLK
jgi:3-methyladenine DNA glycosylase AlkD